MIVVVVVVLVMVMMVNCCSCCYCYYCCYCSLLDVDDVDVGGVAVCWVSRGRIGTVWCGEWWVPLAYYYCYCCCYDSRHFYVTIALLSSCACCDQ